MLTNVLDFLNKEVELIIDRPLGSKHPKHGYTYEVNYGYVPNTKASDGEEIDAYVLGLDKPVNIISGICIAIVHRMEEEDDKLVVTTKGEEFSDKEIEKLVNFQEKWFKHKILRAKL